MTQSQSAEAIRAAVEARYATAARTIANLQGRVEGSTATTPNLQAEPESAGCCAPTCCSPDSAAEQSADGTTASARVLLDDPITTDLYDDQAAQVSASALEASLGCGNPTALADLSPGETVLDLGSGGGLDVLLSARRVGPTGHAYGLDMTPEMLDLARANQSEAGVENATFLKGTLEEIPLPDASVDVVISNCVINLTADKGAVLAEAFRVLRPGGRFAVSDMVLTTPRPQAQSDNGQLPRAQEQSADELLAWTGCLSGAILREDYLAALANAGFSDASIEVTRTFEEVTGRDPGIVSAFIRAQRPA